MTQALESEGRPATDHGGTVGLGTGRLDRTVSDSAGESDSPGAAVTRDFTVTVQSHRVKFKLPVTDGDTHRDGAPKSRQYSSRTQCHCDS